jgi:chaperone required for assembly of F1-ATPase
MKRRYKSVEVSESGSGFALSLDGKPMRTPAGNPLAAAPRALAEAIAEEWRAQGEAVDPRSMPMTQFVATALDRVPGVRERIVHDLAAFAETDLLCHRADGPPPLVERQVREWQPLLDWAAAALDAPFVVCAGVMPVEQPKAARAAIRSRIEGLDDLRLVALQTLAGGTGSIVLAFAVMEGRLGWEEAHRLSRLDEDFQIEKWGEDPEAAKSRQGIHEDLRQAARLLSLARVRH